MDGRKEVQRDEWINELINELITNKIINILLGQLPSLLFQENKEEENKKLVQKRTEIPRENKEAKGHPYLSPFPEWWS